MSADRDNRKCRVSTLPSEGRHMSHYCRLEAEHKGEHKFDQYCELCKPKHIDEAKALYQIVSDQARMHMLWHIWKERHHEISDHCCNDTSKLFKHIENMECNLVDFLATSEAFKGLMGPDTQRRAGLLKKAIREREAGRSLSPEDQNQIDEEIGKMLASKLGLPEGVSIKVSSVTEDQLDVIKEIVRQPKPDDTKH